MQPRSAKLLLDMRTAGSFIVRHAGTVALTDYLANEFLRLSVERQFEIVGEAARRIALSDPATAALLPGIPQIVAFRNVIAHGYDDIDHERVLEIIRTSLPALLSQIDTLLPPAD